MQPIKKAKRSVWWHYSYWWLVCLSDCGHFSGNGGLLDTLLCISFCKPGHIMHITDVSVYWDKTEVCVSGGSLFKDGLFWGTGDCIVASGYLGGGFNDEYHQWLVECADGEAMIGEFSLSFSSVRTYSLFSLIRVGDVPVVRIWGTSFQIWCTSNQQKVSRNHLAFSHKAIHLRQHVEESLSHLRTW